MRIGYKKVKTLIFDPKKLFLKWASVKLKSSLHLTPCLTQLHFIQSIFYKVFLIQEYFAAAPPTPSV